MLKYTRKQKHHERDPKAFMKYIVLGSDHAAFQLKSDIASFLTEKGYTVEDCGCDSEHQSVDYPSIAEKVALKINDIQTTKPQAETMGILCCGSGVGVAMSANRFPWIRAVRAHESLSARLSREHNNANVLCLGARLIAKEMALDILETWLATPFDGGRHERRVSMMSDLTPSTADLPKESSSCSI